MRLPGDDELYRTLRIGQQGEQPLGVVKQQVRPLVGREAARKSQRQHAGIKEMPGGFDLFGRGARGGQQPGQPFADALHKGPAGFGAKMPDPGVGHPANVLFQGFRRAQPAVLATGFRPEIVGGRRVPRGHVDSVGDVSDRDFVFRPARKQRLEQATAHLPVQAAHPIRRTAPAECQVRHVERLRRVGRILAAKCQQIVKRNAEPLFCVPAKVLLDQGRSEMVESRGHRRVGSEEVTRPSGRQSDLEGLPGILHEVAGAFQDGERRVPFIQVTDLGLDSQRTEQPPSADAEQQFLLEAQFRSTPIELAGNPPVSGKVRRVIAVQQVELHSADLNLPGTQPDRVSGQRDL